MVAEGIIEPVTEPTDRCHPIVVVDKKKSSEKKLTVDLKSLNSQVKRPAHPMAMPCDLLPNIGTSKWFTKVDASHGYWQIPLSDAAKPLTTFITPWGRFQYLRNPWVPGMCSCFGQLQARGAWFGDSLKADPQTPRPKAGKANTACCLVFFENVVRSVHAHSFRTEVVR